MWKKWKKWWPEWALYCGIFVFAFAFVWANLEWPEAGRSVASVKADHYEHVVYDW